MSITTESDFAEGLRVEVVAAGDRDLEDDG